MTLRRTGPLLAVLMAVLGLVAASVDGMPTAITMCIGLPTTLLVPGYAFTRLVWPSGRLTTAARLLFIAASSIALLILSGLVTAALPVGLSAVSIATTLLIVTAVSAGFTLLSERGRANETHGNAAHRWRRRDVAGLTLALLVAFSSIVIARMAADHTARRTSATQLYAVSRSGGQEVTVGIANAEAHGATFRLVVRATRGPAFSQAVAAIRLAPGATFSRTLRLPEGLSAKSLRIDLYRDNETRVYRTVG